MLRGRSILSPSSRFRVQALSFPALYGSPSAVTHIRSLRPSSWRIRQINSLVCFIVVIWFCKAHFASFLIKEVTYVEFFPSFFDMQTNIFGNFASRRMLPFILMAFAVPVNYFVRGSTFHPREVGVNLIQIFASMNLLFIIVLDALSVVAIRTRILPATFSKFSDNASQTLMKDHKSIQMRHTLAWCMNSLVSSTFI